LAPPHDTGPSLYLSLEALEAQRRSVVEAFHAGRVVPARGRAAEIRLEAHVAVLAQLQRAFAGDEARAPREPAEVVRIARAEAWVGLADITHALELEARGASGLHDGAVRAADKYDEIYDLPRRWLGVIDVSESGWLLEGPGADAAGLLVGELIALRFNPGTRCVLGTVVRSVRPAHGDGVQVGVQRLSHPGMPPRPCKLRPDTGDEATYLFVPGDDASGRRDGFVVPYRVLESNERFRVRRGGRDYALAFNRVRRRGRGWALAGYEMVDASAWEIVVA
jgi:hypothetical protein